MVLDLTAKGPYATAPHGNLTDWVRRHYEYDNVQATRSCCEGQATEDEFGGFVQRAPGPLARRDGQLCRAWRGARPRHAGQPARRDAYRIARHEGAGRQRSGSARYNLSHCLND